MIPGRQPRIIEEGTPARSTWIIGEAPGETEVATGRPFSGPSGHLLDSLLLEVGIQRSNCFLTNVCHERPPGNEIDKFFTTKTFGRTNGLHLELGRYMHEPVRAGLAHLQHLFTTANQPNLVIALGGTALWALTGEQGIMKWRGSAMTAATTTAIDTRVLPTIHPASILREYSHRYLALQDLRRWNKPAAFTRPNWNFTTQPSAADVLLRLRILSMALDRAGPSGLPIVCDIETRGRQIACVGLAWTQLDALCTPLMCLERPEGYFNAEEEHEIILALRAVLTHPNIRVIFQNGAYDLQYFACQYGFLPKIRDDTMLMQHTCFPGLRKGLDFLSSLYCAYHRYWKDDGKEWYAGGVGDENRHWTYNCEDCVRTLEVFHTLDQVVDAMGLRPQYQFQMRFFSILLRMMLKGVKVDFARRQRMREELEDYIVKANEWFERALGHPINTNSPAQMQSLFYEDFRLPVIKNRKTGQPTLDAEALEKIKRRNPVLRPLVQRISDVRTARTTLANVLEAQLPEDGRARCTYNGAGTETFRLSSSEDAFGYGFNLQNLAKGTEE